jgi:hypothetical protein
VSDNYDDNLWLVEKQALQKQDQSVDIGDSASVKEESEQTVENDFESIRTISSKQQETISARQPSISNSISITFTDTDGIKSGHQTSSVSHKQEILLQNRVQNEPTLLLSDHNSVVGSSELNSQVHDEQNDQSAMDTVV